VEILQALYCRGLLSVKQAIKLWRQAKKARNDNDITVVFREIVSRQLVHDRIEVEAFSLCFAISESLGTVVSKR
jgi:hypothetical protein